MPFKTLLFVFTVIIFTSCTTAYKSGQTVDDVYYSPVRFIDEKQDNDRDRDEAKNDETTKEERRIRFQIRDRRLRDLDDNRGYSYTPYGYCTCVCTNHSYYYNPFFNHWPVYVPKATTSNIPRMVNLNSYTGFNNNIVIPKSGNTNNSTSSGIKWKIPSGSYNNSNSSGTRTTLTPSGSSSSNKTRTYSPSSSSSSSSSGSVSRPGRG